MGFFQAPVYRICSAGLPGPEQKDSSFRIIPAFLLSDSFMDRGSRGVSGGTAPALCLHKAEFPGKGNLPYATNISQSILHCKVHDNK